MRRLMVLLTAGMLAVALAAPAAVSARGSTYQVPRPNGRDDTANIQKALDWCVAHGPGCTVQLQAGTYRTSQLVTYNFRGTFTGAGQSRTTVAALRNVLVTWPDPVVKGQCLPNLTDCRWPTLMIFVDGAIAVSDMALDFPHTNGTATTLWAFGGTAYSGFADALRFMGDRRTDVSVDRVRVTGRRDTSPTSFFGTGFNVLQGIYFAGDLPSAPYLAGANQTYATVSGSFAVRASSVKTVVYGILTGGMAESGLRVTIGGSPTAGNRVEDGPYGIEIGSESSAYDVSYNVLSAAGGDGVLVIPLNVGMTPGTHSRFAIHDNTIITTNPCNCLSVGIHLYDYLDVGPVSHWIQATIWNNTIRLRDATPLSEGIDANNTTGTLITGNTVTGTGGGDAISLWGNDPAWLPSTGNLVADNDVRGFSPDQANGLAQIYLDSYADHNVVVCARRSDTVLDQGTANKIVGCDPPTATLKAAARVAPITTRIRMEAPPRLH